jgi:hypothetical protein
MDAITLTFARDSLRESSATVGLNVLPRVNKSDNCVHLQDVTKPATAGIHFE